MTFAEAAALLTVTPGNLVYHLTLTMALAVMLVISQVYRLRLSYPTATRWSLASGSLLILHIIFLAIEVLIWVDIVEMGVVLPALDRFIIFIGIIVFAWVCYLPSQKTCNWLLVSGSVIGVLGLVLTPVIINAQPSPTPFNHTWIDAAWSIISFFVALAATILLLALRPRFWEYMVPPFGLLTIGTMLHISLGPTNASSAGFIRMAEIIAYPLFAILAAKQLSSAHIDEMSRKDSFFSAASPKELDSLVEAVSDLTTLASSRNQVHLASQTVETITRMMRPNLCLLMTPEDDQRKVGIVAGYDLLDEEHIPRMKIDAESIPLISTALAHAESLELQYQSNPQEFTAMTSTIGKDIEGSALLVPLTAGHEIVGGFLLISASLQVPWTSDDRKTISDVASLFARRFQDLKQLDMIKQARRRDADLKRAKERIQTLEEKNTRLEDALEAQNMDESSMSTEDLQSLLAMHEQDQEVIEELRAEIEELSSEGRGNESAEQFEELSRQHQVVLEELAETRHSLLLLEQEPKEDLTQSKDDTLDSQPIVTIAEELRQPLASTFGYTELLLSETVGLLGTIQKKFLVRIRDATRRMETLLNELLTIVAPDTVLLTLDSTPVDLMHCVEKALDQVSTHLQEKRVTLCVDVHDDIPPLLGDEDAVIQILYYLLENAIEVSNQGGSVMIHSEEHIINSDHFVMFSVKDSGEGIPPEELQRVFQRTYGTEASSIQGVGDSGYGLPIVKSLCENYGGRVWVESEMGSGSTFFCLLPVIQASVAYSTVEQP